MTPTTLLRWALRACALLLGAQAFAAPVQAPSTIPAAPAFAKALGDAHADVVFTPVTPCRLVDTRGFDAPFQGGLFQPGERRAYAPNGRCGLPGAGVVTIAASVTTLNLTPASGGFLALLSPGAPVRTTVDIFNFGTSWSGSSTLVPTGPAGQFDTLVELATAHVVIDVVGYFAPPQGAIPGGVPSHATGFFNTFVGESAGNVTILGAHNTALGSRTLTADTTGEGNTALGSGALFNNTEGALNTAAGKGAMLLNTTGARNAAFGGGALTSNVSGAENTAVGVFALGSNTVGSLNTAVGSNALSGNVDGTSNTAVGQFSMFANTLGVGNTAMGVRALSTTLSGTGNTAYGAAALRNVANGHENIALGLLAGSALTTGDSNIYVGHLGAAVESNTIRIGEEQSRTFIAGVRGTATGVGDAVPVVIDSQGQLGTLNSSRRFKSDIADMADASTGLMKLRPVTFHYTADPAPGSRLQYGLIAEEVAAVYPGLVTHSADGQAETVMYQYLPAMLLNELQKQQRAMAAMAAEIADLKRRLAP